MRVYISGPMSGYPEFNYPEFHRVADEWRKLGHDVFCPAENFKGSTDYPWEFYMKEDLRLVMHCDAIVMLDGWANSRGAIIEAITAKTCGLLMMNASGREYTTINLGSLGFLLKVWHDEHSYQREDEEREINSDGSLHQPIPVSVRETEPSRSAQGSSSDTRLEGKEPGNSTGLGSVGVRESTPKIPGTYVGELWETEPAGRPRNL